MLSTRHALGIAAAAMLTAQPCLAADDVGESRTGQVRTGAFAGVSLRVPLDRNASSRRPTARLQLTSIRQVREANGATRTWRAEGVQIGADRDGGFALTIAGRNPFDACERLGVGGSTGTALLVVGGLVLVVFVLASVADGMPTAGPPEGAFD
ncbi:MAG TPA: hypothetical protein VEW25_12355 [Allosphingosinicella sp.]|nr:hypothetical protein [Allosphingosinicella sp.]